MQIFCQKNIPTFASEDIKVNNMIHNGTLGFTLCPMQNYKEYFK